MSYSPIVLDQKHREMFDARVDRRGPEECWIWTGQKQTTGYGVLTLCKGGDRKNYLAHRVAWAIAHSEVPTNRMVCHTCDNPPCCNPAHLFLGDAKANVADMIAKGRHAHGETSGMLHIRGAAHPASKYSDEERAEACRLFFVERWTALRIAAHFDCNRRSVARWLNDAGISSCDHLRRRPIRPPDRPAPPRNLAYTQEDRDRAKALRAQGWTVARIAREIGCSHLTASKWLRESAKPRRPLIEMKAEAYRMKYEEKMKIRRIAAKLGVHRTSVTRWLADARALLGD